MYQCFTSKEIDGTQLKNAGKTVYKLYQFIVKAVDN